MEKFSSVKVLGSAMVFLVLAVGLGLVLIIYTGGLNFSNSTALNKATIAALNTPAASMSAAPLPNAFTSLVPFTAQAPTGNWDQEHQEACEEASAIMANAYLTGSTAETLRAPDVEVQISKLNLWEQRNLGYNFDTTSGETAQMIEAVYGLKTKLIQSFTADDLKRELVAGHTVLISENGRELGNPNYKQPGPIHHMLVVRGYSAEGFITNDPGTRYGENYLYSFDVLQKAAADWNHSLNIVDSNNKVAIVVYK